MKAARKNGRFRGLISTVGMALMGAAVVKELRKPKAERTWHGKLGGRIPYEFRPITMERLRQAYWAPEDEHVFTDTAFGVGWSVNFGKIAHAITDAYRKARGSGTDPSPAAA